MSLISNFKRSKNEVDERSNYIDWIFNLENELRRFGIEFSEYDEFYVNDAIQETERIIREYEVTHSGMLTESMIDEYMYSAIKREPSRKEYFETVSSYVKKRLLQ